MSMTGQLRGGAPFAAYHRPGGRQAEPAVRLLRQIAQATVQGLNLLKLGRAILLPRYALDSGQSAPSLGEPGFR
jgi:hypothetical protein